MSEAPAKRFISTQQAAFIGVAAMVGAGIFSLLGAAGEVAGAAVWLSFLLAGGIAALQGYSFAKLGAKFPSAGGLLEYVNQGFGDGHIATVVAWLTYIANGIVTAMVALSFGSYASSAFAGDNATWVKIFAVALLVTMTILNIAGSGVVARVQSLVVFVVIGILAFFSLVTVANIEPGNLAPSTYPGPQDIVSSVALTFFAFLGFGVVTFTAKDLAKPGQQLPRAMAIALGLATVIYVAVSIGVFGSLSVPEVIAAGPTAISAVASIGSAVALVIFAVVTLGHLRILDVTGARRSIVLLALAAVTITLATFIVTTLIHEPASMVTLVAILVLSIVLDVAWSRRRDRPAGEDDDHPATDVPRPVEGGPA